MARKRIVSTSATLVAVLLAVALTVMVNWLGYRHYVRADWTASNIYSLSAKSLGIVEGLDIPVRVIVFMTPTTPLFEETKELLDRYQAASPEISVEYIDPDREPLKTQQLADEFDVTAANTVVFIAGDNKKYVTSDQLAEYDYSQAQYGQPPKLKAFKGEQAFTAAILGVVNPRQPKVCFTTGHGERDLSGTGADGMSQLRDALTKENMTTDTVSLLSGAVPEGCDTLAIVGPKAPFTDAEKSAISAYLDGGGRVIALLDPVLGGRSRPSGLKDLLAAHGAQLQDDLVVDPSRRLPFFDLSAVYASDFKPHPVTEGLEGLAVLLPVARSVKAEPGQGMTATPLVTTSADGWGETDLAGILAGTPIDKDDADIPGPVTLAVAAQAETGDEAKPENGWRLVVVGDSDFVSNGQLVNAGNLNLATNAFNWLAQREQALGIAPREPEQVQLFLSASQMRTVNLVALLLLPGLAVMLGVVAWWRRRR